MDNKHEISLYQQDNKLERIKVCKDFLHTTQHGAIAGKIQKKSLKLYNLDVIISVGYRIKSKRGTSFRIWATQVIKEYLLRGYVFSQRIQTYITNYASTPS